MSTEKFNDPEILAEVFKVIRANTHLSAKALFEVIQDHLPDVSKEEIFSYIEDLKTKLYPKD